MRPRDLAIYLFLAIVWGLSFLVLLRVVQAFGWVGAVTLRSLLAGGSLLVAAAIARRPLHIRRHWRPLLVVGATTVAGQLIGLSFATPRIGTAMAAIFVTAIPLFSMLIGQAWGTERITLRGLAGLGLGTLGIVLLVGFPEVPMTGSFIVGCACALLASFSAAFGSNYASRHLHHVGAWEVTTGSFLIGGVMTLPLLFLVPVPAWPQPVDYLYLLVLSVVMSALNYVLYFRLVAAIGATRTISVEFVVTIVAVLVGALLLQESLSLVQIAGALTILAGCALVLGLIPRRRARD
jgi:drug/metabolite transporter (DMT)-like permease